MSKDTEYKVMACFDTETTNDNESKKAFAICYQLSILKDRHIACNTITNDNVHSCIDITVDRHFKDVCNRFEELIRYGKAEGIVPVVMVHNLAFEMWILSSYINEHEADACAKSSVKPLTITIRDMGEPVLVFWDTLSFWGKSLEKLGDECGYHKLSGCWDYEKYRTPDTPLTEMELAYASEDVTVPWCYMGYYLRLNPEIDEHDLARKVLTKTSAVRYKSMKRCGNIKVDGKTTGYMWRRQNRSQKPKTDNELELLHAANRGGFTYCAANHASKVFEKGGGYRILKYDANSMHICHALSHRVPRDYRWVDAKRMIREFNTVGKYTVSDVLERYDNPFPCSKFIGVFRFTNVRLKEGSIFERDGISSFAWSKFATYVENSMLLEDNEGGAAFDNAIREKGYHDYAPSGCDHAFGKFYGASECTLILNELSAWEFHQEFDFDTVSYVGDKGLWTGRSTFATDKSVLSFNEFYKAKTVFKHLKGTYEGILEGDTSQEYGEVPDFVPKYLFDKMEYGDPDAKPEVESFYLSVKAELNSLYGIEATNEAKNEILLTKEGLALDEYKGVDGLPDNPKAWYQYGSHIVGWSRIHQLIFMLLLQDKVDAFICGDTDSHKIYTRYDDADIQEALKPLHDACDTALEKCTARARAVREWYPMDGLGWYECEGECDALMASWNKSYIQLSHGKVDITMAGVPCDTRFRLPDGTELDRGYNKMANDLYRNGWSFEGIADTLLGYNVTISYDVTGLNQRSLPEWGAIHPCGEPEAIRIYRMDKTIGDTAKEENRLNMAHAIANNPDIGTEPVYVTWSRDGKPRIEVS